MGARLLFSPLFFSVENHAVHSRLCRRVFFLSLSLSLSSDLGLIDEWWKRMLGPSALLVQLCYRSMWIYHLMMHQRPIFIFSIYFFLCLCFVGQVDSWGRRPSHLPCNVFSPLYLFLIGEKIFRILTGLLFFLFFKTIYLEYS